MKQIKNEIYASISEMFRHVFSVSVIVSFLGCTKRYNVKRCILYNYKCTFVPSSCIFFTLLCFMQIENHNSFLISVYEQSKCSNCHYRKYLPDSPPELYATEVTSQNCIVPSDGGSGKQQFLKLIKSCSMYNGANSSPIFDLKQLEQNIVAFHIAGKPQIQSGSIRTIFRFRNSPNDTILRNRYQAVKFV